MYQIINHEQILHKMLSSFQVLEHGDRHYQESVEYLQKNEKFDKKFLLLSEILTKCKLLNKQIHFNVEECFLNGIINAKKENDLMDLKRVYTANLWIAINECLNLIFFQGLEIFFEDNTSAIVTCRNISIGVWKNEHCYYCFDSHDRDENGLFTSKFLFRYVPLHDKLYVQRPVRPNFVSLAQHQISVGRENLQLSQITKGNK